MAAIMSARIFPYPTVEDVAAKYQLLTTEELEKLVLVLVDTEPPDTGAPKGQPRYYHCKGKTKKCELCRSWIRWQTEFDLLGRELARRWRLQWGA
jgi:hypothetical protein